MSGFWPDKLYNQESLPPQKATGSELVPLAGIGPATSPLPRECSTTEPQGRNSHPPQGRNSHWQLPVQLCRVNLCVSLERETGIEPVSLAWKAKVLPLNYSRVGSRSLVGRLPRCGARRARFWAFLLRASSRLTHTPPKGLRQERVGTGRKSLGDLLNHPFVATARCVVSVSERWWRRLDSNQRRRKPTDLQSAPFSHSGTPPQHRARYYDTKRTLASSPPAPPVDAVAGGRKVTALCHEALLEVVRRVSGDEQPICGRLLRSGQGCEGLVCEALCFAAPQHETGLWTLSSHRLQQFLRK
jgi:hypothetical protein